MIVDTDDLWEGHDRMDLLLALKEANPLFKVTAFAVPARCSDAYVDSLPDFIEVAVHGWAHGDPPSDGGEWRNWTADRMRELLDVMDTRTTRWARGAKAPGWIISDGCYEALAEAGYWIADQHLEDHRRPPGLRTYFYEDGADRIHTHVQNVCGNGLEETWEELRELVANAPGFRFASEAAN